jgi:pyrroline-5-carboxylate reductase
MASNRRSQPLESLRAELPGLQIGATRDIASKADMVIVCVQPERYLHVVEEVANALRPEAIFVSITNGATLEDIADKTSAPIVKVIPTVTNAVGRGVALVTKGPRASPDDIEAVQAFFRPFSLPVMIPREDNRIATNITGCGPALLACFCNQLAQSSIDRARYLDADTVKTMLRETLLATAALVEAGTDLEAIIRHAATRGGATQAALDVLNEKLPELLKQMVEATFAAHAAENATNSDRMKEDIT